MDGIIAVIVAFIFVCILFPKLVRNPTQFYAAFGMVLLVVVLQTLARMFGSSASEGFGRFVAVCDGFLTAASLLLVVMATGGLSLKDLTGEFTKAIEVIRRGEEQKEIIVPITGQMPKPRRREAVPMEDEPVVHTIETPPAATPERKPGDPSSIPLE
jgi:hypothetical protein